VFEKLYHHRFGNERSHSSRHDYDTQDAAERMSHHSAKAALSLVASVELSDYQPHWDLAITREKKGPERTRMRVLREDPATAVIGASHSDAK
jgi:hypothetical protein